MRVEEEVLEADDEARVRRIHVLVVPPDPKVQQVVVVGRLVRLVAHGHARVRDGARARLRVVVACVEIDR